MTKTVFLIEITSARWVNKIAALTASSPETIFHKDKVVLWLHPSFLPKVCSDFHINEPVVLLALNQSLMLPERRLLCIPWMFRGHYPSISTGKVICFSCWARSGNATFIAAYFQVNNMFHHLMLLPSKRPLPGSPMAHSTQAVAASRAFLKGVPFKDSCCAATWSYNHIFMRHYTVSIWMETSSPGSKVALSSAHKH